MIEVLTLIFIAETVGVAFSVIVWFAMLGVYMKKYIGYKVYDEICEHKALKHLVVLSNVIAFFVVTDVVTLIILLLCKEIS